MPSKKQGSVKLPKMWKVNRAARVRGLYALAEGTGNSLKYSFWDKKTGKLVLVYYPSRKRWVMPGVGNRDGEAGDFVEALAFGFDMAYAPQSHQGEAGGDPAREEE